MSNEYKDWIIDKIQEEVLEQGLIDKIIDIYNGCYVEGLKNGKLIKYYVTLTNEEWLCRHQEFN